MGAYFGGGCGSGRSELNISTAANHLPSGCLHTIVTNLPESLTGPGISSDRTSEDGGKVTARARKDEKMPDKMTITQLLVNEK
jgi:hypothetical protein